MTPNLPALPIQSLARLVENSLTSPHSKRVYSRALARFLGWHEPTKGPVSREVVQEYRSYLEAQGKKPATINVALAVLRKLAHEAHAVGQLDKATADGITSIPGVKVLGLRTGNWLSLEDARRLMVMPDTSTAIGLRDKAMLAMLLGCALRRSEAANATVEHFQLREGRWALVDLTGKGQRVRTVMVPAWAAAAIRAWLDAANITSGRILRTTAAGSQRYDQTAIYARVRHYSEKMGVEFEPHDLRRTHAKLARAGGADMIQIQMGLGHSSVATTERYLGSEQSFSDAPGDRMGL
jgi:integrase